MMKKSLEFVKDISEIAGKPNKLTQIFLEDHGSVFYKPSFVNITGSVMSAILLNQIMYWAKKTGNHFYKFRNSCDHKLYKSGDSWCEELGFTGHEFDGALKKIGQRLKAGIKPLEDVFVWFYTDFNRVTWYSVNWKYLNQEIYKNYDIADDFQENQELITKSGNSYLRNSEIGEANYEIRNELITKSENSIYDTVTTNKDYNRRQATTPQQPKTENPPVDKNDDDDLYLLLSKFGLNKSQCVKIMKVLSVDEIKYRYDKIVKHIRSGGVKNVPAYAFSVFSDQGEVSITEEIEKEKKKTAANNALKIAEEIKAQKQAEEDDKRREYEENLKTERIIESASDDDIERFEEYLVDKRFLFGQYLERKFESLFVKTAFVEFMEGRNG